MVDWKKIVVVAMVAWVVIITIQPLANDPVIHVQQLGTDANGYQVRGQTCWYVDAQGHEIGVAYVAIDIDWVNSSVEPAILAHEFGHVTNSSRTEAQCDAFAFQVTGINITDAYEGIR